MKKIFLFLFIGFICTYVMVRPCIPGIINIIIKETTGAHSPSHTWLVQQFWKEVEKKKGKFADSVKVIIESSHLFQAQEITKINLQFYYKYKSIGVVVVAVFVNQFLSCIFQPPEVHSF